MTTPLPPYGTATRCAKCTSEYIDDSYQPARPTIVHTSQGAELLTTHNPTGDECLLRTCRDCGWAWLEACAGVEFVTEIDTGRGKIEFAQPVTRAWAKDYADRFLRGVPPTLLPQDAP